MAKSCPILCNSMNWSMPGFPVLHYLPVFAQTHWQCSLCQWCHSTVSSSVIPVSSWPQSFPASGSSPMSWLFASCGQSIGVSASVLPMNIQGWFPLHIYWAFTLWQALDIHYLVPSPMNMSHPPSSPFTPTFNLSQHQSLFKWIISLHHVAKVLEFQLHRQTFHEYSGLIFFRMDWLDLLESKGLSRLFSNTTVQKQQFFGAQLSL